MSLSNSPNFIETGLCKKGKVYIIKMLQRKSKS